MEITYVESGPYVTRTIIDHGSLNTERITEEAVGLILSDGFTTRVDYDALYGEKEDADNLADALAEALRDLYELAGVKEIIAQHDTKLSSRKVALRGTRAGAIEAALLRWEES